MFDTLLYILVFEVEMLNHIIGWGKLKCLSPIINTNYFGVGGTMFICFLFSPFWRRDFVLGRGEGRDGCFMQAL